MYSGHALQEMVESFMFGIFSNAVTFRDIYLRVVNFKEEGNYLGITEELTRFLKDMLIFDSLYTKNGSSYNIEPL